MNKRFVITEEERQEIRKKYFFEQNEKSEDRKFCHKGNTKTLEEVMGIDEPEDYIEGVKLRKSGVNGLADHIELLKTMRLHNSITDGGTHLAHTVMNNLKSYKPYNYFEENTKECNRAMDKIIELYKENKHGEELVKDIEKIYELDHIDPRAKEFMKHSLAMIKGD
jgi:hypothetical protein